MIFSQSKLLNKFTNITHAYTTKDSGNLAFHVNDNILHVKNNHKNLAKNLSYKKHKLIHMEQIHSDIVHVVTKNDDFLTTPTCDALITDITDTPLMVMVADCSPILFYDNEKKVIAVAHAGRQGAFKNIIKTTLNSFTNIFNSNTSSIYVSIGASIGSCCYEVGAEIYTEAKELKLDYAIEIRDNSYYLNIRNILKKQLLDAGIYEKHIDISQECNCCKNDKYFSYRANKNCGRFAGVIKLNF